MPCLGWGGSVQRCRGERPHTQGSSPGLAHRTASPRASHTPPPAPSWCTHWLTRPPDRPPLPWGPWHRGPGLGSARAPGVTPSACIPRGRLRPAWAIVQVCPGTEVARLLRPTPARRPRPPPGGTALLLSWGLSTGWCRRPGLSQRLFGPRPHCPPSVPHPHICKSRPCSGHLTGWVRPAFSLGSTRVPLQRVLGPLRAGWVGHALFWARTPCPAPDHVAASARARGRGAGSGRHPASDPQRPITVPGRGTHLSLARAGSHIPGPLPALLQASRGLTPLYPNTPAPRHPAP